MPEQYSMLISLCSETDKKYSDKQIITDIPKLGSFLRKITVQEIFILLFFIIDC